MKVINTTRAMGTSLIALGIAVGFAHEAAASKINGLYKATEICKVTVTDNTGSVPVLVKAYGTKTDYSVKIDAVKDTKSTTCDEFVSEAPSGQTPEGDAITLETPSACVDVKAYFVSKDDKRKYLYKGTVYYGEPTFDEDYKAISMSVMRLDQCYGFDEKDYVVTYDRKAQEYFGHGRYNFIGHGFIPDLVDLSSGEVTIDDVTNDNGNVVDEDCKILLVKSRDKDVRKHLSKADLPKNFFCGADWGDL